MSSPWSIHGCFAAETRRFECRLNDSRETFSLKHCNAPLRRSLGCRYYVANFPRCHLPIFHPSSGPEQNLESHPFRGSTRKSEVSPKVLIASMKIAVKAGPPPQIAVAASIRCSCSVYMVFPKRLSSSCAVSTQGIASVDVVKIVIPS